MIRLFFLLFSLCSFVHANDEHDIAKISEAMGHLIGKNLEALGVNLDLKAVVKGLSDASEGKHAPMNEEECVQALAVLQEEYLTELGEKNRFEAEEFLEKNQDQEGIITLEEGKLQYKVVRPGAGEELKSYNSPLIRYTAKYLNGEIITQTAEADLISLDETIDGLSKGLLGMQEGEVRTLYLHPDLAYGPEHPLSPNALVIFEVELLKTEGTKERQTEALLPDLFQKPEREDPTAMQ